MLTDRPTSLLLLPLLWLALLSVAAFSMSWQQDVVASVWLLFAGPMMVVDVNYQIVDVAVWNALTETHDLEVMAVGVEK